MDERSVRLVKMSLVSQKKNLSKLTKYHYVYAISLIRFISPLINKITIQNYVNKTHSMVDYFLEISEKNMFLFFSLISKNMTYNYDQLINITCIDNLNLSNYHKNMGRFSLVYVLNSINTTSRLLVSLTFSANTIIMSLSSIFKSATWLEREIYDLFGVFFFKHNDLRRILTDYGFKGFPLRKDFPLTGYVELRYNEELKSVKYQRLKLMQEYRYFNFESPWKQDSNLIKKHEVF